VLKIRIGVKKEVFFGFKSHVMSKIKLYIATSIDGYIARKNNSLDWLYALENPNNIDHDYGAFLSGIDAVVLGRNTYEEIMSFGVEWPYADCDTYILTSSSEFKIQTPRTSLLNILDINAVVQLKAKSKKDIWIVGGGRLISGFLDLEAIDEMTITIIPTLLGEGIPLFPNNPKETRFELINAESFETGAVNLNYKRRG
jgi:dihydrofolate reductase